MVEHSAGDSSWVATNLYGAIISIRV